MPVYDNVDAKGKLFFIADEPYFFANAAPRDMERYYSSVYRDFDRENFYLYLMKFGLDGRRRIRTFSKGNAQAAGRYRRAVRRDEISVLR